MAKTVTVDADDLETLLYGVGALRQVEQAMVLQKQDPWIAKAKPKLTGAADRMLGQWREATRDRKVADPLSLEPMNEHDFSDLQMMGISTPTTVAYTANIEAWRQLRLKLLVEIGSVHHVIRWGEGDTAAETEKRMAVRLTAKGRAGWKKLWEKQRS